MKGRVFEVCQRAKHPKTNEILMTEKQIQEGLSHKTITRSAYVLHDKDNYTEEDEKKNPLLIKGTHKDDHYHIVMETKYNQMDTATIAKWFNVPENLVEVKKGAGAFLDCVEYLTHENPKQQEKGKHLYEDSEIHTNFAFREELNRRKEMNAKYGKDITKSELMLYQVLYEGKTLSQCIEEDKFIYQKNLDKLKKFRMDYLSRQKPPTTRINYYVTGKGGIGKGLICRAIARSLYPNHTEDEDIFFEVGAKGAAFEGYDGQPVIIWNDRRAIDLLTELNGRGNVFNIFDTHPTKQKQNIKYGSINLPNTVNIVNSVQPYVEFLDSLAGGYTDRSGEEHEAEDKGQSYRRFPLIIPLHEEDFDILINRGFLYNTKDFCDYLEYKNIIGNLQEIAITCGQNEKLRKKIEAQTVKPIINWHNNLVEQNKEKELGEENIIEKFRNYGRQRH